MTQDYLFTEISVKVRSICDELGYTCRFFRSTLTFRVYARKNNSCLFISSILIEKISQIEHVEFNAVVLRDNSMNAFFCIDDLSLCV